MKERHAALARLDVLVGRWTVQPKVEGLGTGWTDIDWVEDGQFLRQVTDAEPVPDTAPQAWRENAPFPTTALIGLDDSADEFTMLYADARGVHRVYRMTFADRVWRIRRDAPGFHQRFTGTLSADGDTIDGRWEKSADGVDWTLDFELTYRR
ncbi:hypothetical protein U2F26_28485 [Micromonospora sp. 4G57]|uniref:DUF1579 domain-containing protein n=1 Tax=Micromonospora sicca TaxID=2202420 RepID=A0ABU5JC12_9ACTN|nr:MULTISPECIES: hypothetical protein [unclassified Micromonospora]MDZ5446616.1 hypothetical protein [Micromonospora sp. 4G57]MDZ5490137.1 hypothetical protein [Micromonospora sp. 4G53]